MMVHIIGTFVFGLVLFLMIMPFAIAVSKDRPKSSPFRYVE